MSKRVFISYEYNEDSNFVNGIKGMIQNPNIDIDFYNESITISIDSSDANYVKHKLKEKINRASILLCIVGQKTRLSNWVKWEITTAKDLGKTICFMRRKDDLSSSMPENILNGTKIKNWDIEYLKDL